MSLLKLSNCIFGKIGRDYVGRKYFFIFIFFIVGIERRFYEKKKYVILEELVKLYRKLLIIS